MDDDQDAQEIIIKLDDLPAGWSEAPPDHGDDEDAATSDCLDATFDAVGVTDLSGWPNSAEALFSQAEFGPFLSTVVVVDFDKTAELFDGIGERYGACDDTVDSDGNKVRVLPVSFPTMGDETFGVRVDLESDFFAITTLFAFARQGDTLLFAVSAAVMSAPDPALVENVRGRSRLNGGRPRRRRRATRWNRG